MPGIRVRTAAVAAAAWLMASPAAAQYGATDGEWRSYAGDTGSTKYSPLDQITPENFDDLEVLWHWESVDSYLVHATEAGDSLIPADALFDILQEEELDRWTAWDGVTQSRSRPSIRSLVATPLMVEGVLYLSTPLYRAAAIDARTGETLWVHDPRAYESGTRRSQNGGTAAWRTGRTMGRRASSGAPEMGFSWPLTPRPVCRPLTSATTGEWTSPRDCRAQRVASAMS